MKKKTETNLFLLIHFNIFKILTYSLSIKRLSGVVGERFDKDFFVDDDLQ
jgi:hypothetical protein